MVVARWAVGRSTSGCKKRRVTVSVTVQARGGRGSRIVNGRDGMQMSTSWLRKTAGGLGQQRIAPESSRLRIGLKPPEPPTEQSGGCRLQNSSRPAFQIPIPASPASPDPALKPPIA